MALFDLFKPKWKHSNPEVRKKYINDSEDLNLLERIGREDKDPLVQQAAQDRHQHFLTTITAVKNAKSLNEIPISLSEIKSASIQEDIVMNAHSKDVKMEMIKSVQDTGLLFQLSEISEDKDIKTSARLQGAKLTEIAGKAADGNPSRDVTIPISIYSPAAIAFQHLYLAAYPCDCGGSWKMVIHNSPIGSGESSMKCQCSGCQKMMWFGFHSY